MASRNKNFTVSSNNSTLIMIVTALVIFGLGYIVGRSKAKIADFSYQTTWRQNMMMDSSYQQQFLDQMMKVDDSRQMMMNAVDNYRDTMMGR